MSPNHLRVLVLDLEMQCWLGPPPEGLANDIIQIGIVELDLEALAPCRERCLYIRPQRCEISPFCTELTGITPEIIRKHGRRFGEALNTIIKEFGPGNKLCLTWGKDRRAIERACLEAEVLNPFDFVDLSSFYAAAQGAKRNVSIEDALKSYGLSFVGRAHDALVDARNTGEVYLEMLRRFRDYEGESGVCA